MYLLIEVETSPSPEMVAAYEQMKADLDKADGICSGDSRPVPEMYATQVARERHGAPKPATSCEDCSYPHLEKKLANQREQIKALTEKNERLVKQNEELSHKVKKAEAEAAYVKSATSYAACVIQVDELKRQRDALLDRVEELESVVNSWRQTAETSRSINDTQRKKIADLTLHLEKLEKDNALLQKHRDQAFDGWLACAKRADASRKEAEELKKQLKPSPVAQPKPDPTEPFVGIFKDLVQKQKEAQARKEANAFPRPYVPTMPYW